MLNNVEKQVSGTYIIECENKELANFVQTCWNKLYDYWYFINPKNFNCDYKISNYRITSVDKILEHLRNKQLDETELNTVKQNLEIKERKGYLFLLGTYTINKEIYNENLVEIFNYNFIPQINYGGMKTCGIMFYKKWN